MPGNNPPSSGNIVELAAARSAPHPQPEPNDPDTAEPGSEDAAALEFSRRHAGELRWVNPWRKWLRWDIACWQLVETLWVYHQVRLVAREYSKMFREKKLARDATTAAIERAARNDPRHDTAPGSWNANMEIFNTPNRKTPS